MLIQRTGIIMAFFIRDEHVTIDHTKDMRTQDPYRVSRHH